MLDLTSGYAGAEKGFLTETQASEAAGARFQRPTSFSSSNEQKQE